MSDSSEPPRRRDRRPPLPPELDPRRPSPRAGRARYGDNSPSPGRGQSRREPPKDRSGKRIAGRFGKIALISLSVLILVGSGITWLTYKKFDAQIARIDVIPHNGKKDVDGEDLNLLLVGNDTRAGATKEQLAELGTEPDGGGTNTDTMILAHIPANGKKATVVSFPRDLWVDIPGLGENKLNAAYGFGSKGGESDEARAKGAKSLINTLDELSGLQIDHYVEVDLLGFYNITKAIDGIEVNLCKPAKDHFSAIDLPAGQQTIQGQQALAFVRQRHGLPRGDLDRIARQQYFIGAVVRKMTSNGVLLNPIKLNSLLNAVTKSLRMDKGLEPLKLAQQMRNLVAGNVEFLTVPNKGNGNINGRSVILPETEQTVHSFFSSLSTKDSKKKSNNGPSKSKQVPHNEVLVQVLNGTTTAGLASRTRSDLQSDEFQVLGIGNTNPISNTTIRYSSDNEDAAQTLASEIPGATLEKNEALNNRVQLILGSDFTGVKGSSSSGGSGNSSGGSSGGQGSSPPASPTPDRTAADAGCIN